MIIRNNAIYCTLKQINHSVQRVNKISPLIIQGHNVSMKNTLQQTITGNTSRQQ